MKKLFVILCLSIPLLIFILGNNNSMSNPYSGKYVYNQNTSLYITLHRNDTFELYEATGKFADYNYGKYSIKNNNITLIFKDNYVFHSKNKLLYGDVQGSRIEFNNVSGYFSKVGN